MELENIRSYWNLRAEGYSMSNMEQYGSREKGYWQDILSYYAPRNRPLRCLEVGCGPGFLSLLMAEQGHLVTATDYSEEMLERAKINAVDLGVKINFSQMDAQNLTFENESFDFIYCRHVTWNLEYPRQAYKEWLRVLSPGGRILIIDSNFYRYYYDSDYSEERDLHTKNDHKYMLGVDGTVIDRIAENLPLSKEDRPAWDLKTFLDLGAKSVHSSVEHRTFVSPSSGERKTLRYSFFITADK